MAELLLELRSEEIPPSMQKPAAKQLLDLLEKELLRLGCEHTKTRRFSTPRRIGVMIEGLPKTLSAQAQEIRGPRINAPEKALAGFRAKHKDFTIAARGDYYYATITQTARPLGKVLSAELPGLLAQIRWPKSMVWPQSGGVSWVRPLRSILCLFDGTSLAFSFAGCEAGNKTYGHPVDAPKSFAVKNYADYQVKMGEAHVLLNTDERAERIRNHAPKADDARIEHLAALSEWPVACEGKIDKRFLTSDMPDEVLDVVLWKHQQCLLEPNGKFLTFADGEKVNQDNARHGAEQVITARLADARFFIDEDLKTGLDKMRETTNSVLWHEKLGSIGDRTELLKTISKEISKKSILDSDNLGQDADGYTASLIPACTYAKADLTSQMVQEFPELQGIMGGFYYRQEKPEDNTEIDNIKVAEAIAQHHRPRGLDDELPEGLVAQTLSLADKMLTLVSFFAINEMPTSSKDPYALRRTALGLIKIFENEIPTSDGATLILTRDRSLQSLCEDFLHQVPFIRQESEIQAKAATLAQFIMRRLQFYLRAQGRPHDLVDSMHGFEKRFSLLQIIRQIEALDDALQQSWGQSLLTIYRRASGILHDEEARDGCRYRYEDYDTAMHGQDSAMMDDLRMAIDDAQRVSHREWKGGIASSISRLEGRFSKPVDDFFEQVRINDPDPKVRKNRLCLLAGVRDVMNQFADFSRIQRKPKA